MSSTYDPRSVTITHNGVPLLQLGREITLDVDLGAPVVFPSFAASFQIDRAAGADLDKLARVVGLDRHVMCRCTIVPLPAPAFKVKRGQKRSARDRRRARVETARRVEIVFETDDDVRARLDDLRGRFRADWPEIAHYFDREGGQ